MIRRTRFRCIAATIAMVACCMTTAAAQAADATYPSRPIRLLVPFAPGGGADATARIFAPKLSEAMGQNWIVDNRTGAGGNLASEIVARANPDGYTVLLVLDSQLTANPSLYKLPFDTEKDLQPVIILSATDQIVVVHPDVPAKTFKEFVALAKQKPGSLRHGSGGVGSTNHLAAELLKKVAGIDIVHVPFKGAGPSLNGLLAGEIQMNISSPASTLGFIKAGRMRAIVRTGTQRSKSMPELPTVAESGYPGFQVLQWYGLVVPGATPRNVVTRIRDASLAALKNADVLAAMDRLGLEPEITTQAELAARIKKERAMWAGVIKEAGIRLE
ncbi:MAG: tripartite tricarboxylate transporter substrate binding protein [Burkholderiales bacterium]|nr:tripartite tricarboxylate transporter substrate binding protein [Burkholderiales bacterium]